MHLHGLQTLAASLGKYVSQGSLQLPWLLFWFYFPHTSCLFDSLPPPTFPPLVQWILSVPACSLPHLQSSRMTSLSLCLALTLVHLWLLPLPLSLSPLSEVPWIVPVGCVFFSWHDTCLRTTYFSSLLPLILQFWDLLLLTQAISHHLWATSLSLPPPPQIFSKKETVWFVFRKICLLLSIGPTLIKTLNVFYLEKKSLRPLFASLPPHSLIQLQNVLAPVYICWYFTG